MTDDMAQIVGDTSQLPMGAGSSWRLAPRGRGLDANVIDLPAHDEIAEHSGPDLDVLIHVLVGSGVVETIDGNLPLEEGTIVWLPPRSRRRIVAGPDGVRYFSVHQRKSGLTIQSAPPPSR